MTVFNLRTISIPIGTEKTLPLIVRSSAPFIGGDNTTPLTTLGVRSIIDLRDEDERQVTPKWDRRFKVYKVPIFQNILATIEWRDLPDLYHIMATNHAQQLARAVEQVALSLHEGPVLIHCTAGKDRTGVVVAFVLAYIGAHRQEILRDYLESTDNLDEEYLLSLAHLHGLESVPGIAAHMATQTDPEALAAAFSVVRASGGIRSYLAKNGASESKLSSLRTQLLGTDAQS